MSTVENENEEAPRQQGTHWYQSDDGAGRRGYTANPFYADPGEVERVGLHECGLYGCLQRHTGNGDDWRRLEAVKALQQAAAGRAQGGHRP